MQLPLIYFLVDFTLINVHVSYINVLSNANNAYIPGQSIYIINQERSNVISKYDI